MAEKEQHHRHALEMKELKANVSFARGDHILMFVGQICALLITLSFIFAGGYLVLQGSQLAGVFVSSIGIVGIVTAFLKRPSGEKK